MAAPDLHPPVLYASSYSKLGDPTHRGIRRYWIDGRTGDLVEDGVFGDQGYSFLAWESSARRLLATSGGSSGGRLTSFATDRSDSLHEVGTQPTGGEEPCHVSVINQGRHALVANYASGSLAVLPLDFSGRPQALSDLASHRGRGPDPVRQTSAHIHMAYVDPTSQIVVAADLGADELRSYRVDAAGRLEHLSTVSAPTGSGPRHMVAVAGGQLAVTDELASKVSLYRLDRVNARITLVDSREASLESRGTTRNYPSEIVADSDGRTIYVANRGLDVVSAFAVDAGELSPLAEWPCGGQWPRHMVLVGSALYLANQRSETLTLLRLGPGPSLRAQARVVAHIPSPVCLVHPSTPDA
jgi:6-phosphogluconolactonase (cycloisomerase 2 family)